MNGFNLGGFMEKGTRWYQAFDRDGVTRAYICPAEFDSLYAFKNLVIDTAKNVSNTSMNVELIHLVCHRLSYVSPLTLF
jgi:hypothetical protein